MPDYAKKTYFSDVVFALVCIFRKVLLNLWKDSLSCFKGYLVNNNVV